MHNILIVEPDRQLARTMQAYLQQYFDIAVSHDAQAAVLEADVRKPGAVILELALAKHNGLAFLQEFRSYTDWLDVPVIIYSHIPLDDTGLTESDWQKQYVVAYLYKPTTSLESLAGHIRGNLRTYETV